MCLSVQRSNEVINPHPGGTPPTLIPHLGVVGHDIDRRIIHDWRRRGESCACGQVASWGGGGGGGRQGQVYSKVTDQNCRTSKRIIYGACRIAIEGVHKQWKLTE